LLERKQNFKEKWSIFRIKQEKLKIDSKKWKREIDLTPSTDSSIRNLSWIFYSGGTEKVGGQSYTQDFEAEWFQTIFGKSRKDGLKLLLGSAKNSGKKGYYTMPERTKQASG